MTPSAKSDSSATNPSPKRQRMTRVERRDQLIGIGRRLFAARGYDAVSIEEIAHAANVSKPVVYEHFGGKEGLYQVIVDRETTAVNTILHAALGTGKSPRESLEAVVLGLLDYIEENPDGFGLMVHQSPDVVAGGRFSTIISDMGDHLDQLLGAYVEKLQFPPDAMSLYAQMLSGLMGIVGQSWAVNRQLEKRVMAAHLVNLMWNGLHHLEAQPTLVTPEN
ncbi:TetR/AcrR family transcriptional regulator [Arcanobacterium pinnipediorum]|uniref:TetR/AcrR family transcriptional regulator n=1 Tax=Arcanobacterium pinnipediorum TaxID=1503041 RepID=A0ABY5AHM1_9ACTO|nr:TetR/AcrR family transcriptional regulator [Arcanobacterium pinnipediorum]USR79211.1 TetR/AcrR family transcriptional regulator [Arcanobacterium pinnipediorum]